jgi:hypothetical protein
MTLLNYPEELFKPSPCDNCKNWTKCKNELLACKPFYSYVHSGRFVYGEKAPSRHLWQRIYLEDSDSPEAKQEAKKFYKRLK